MARIESLEILASGGGKDYLAEVYGKVIDNVQKELISSQLKNTDLSGTPTAGTVEAKRFTNRTSNAYGTARSNGGVKVTALPVTVSINIDRELITEVEEKDVQLYGVDSFIARQSRLDQNSMGRELERAFFETAAYNATELSTSETDIEKKIEALIQSVENTQNDYVDGVPRDMISVILDTSTYGDLRNKIDTVAGHNVLTSAEEIKVFHGVKIYSTVYMPAGIKALCMIKGAVAEPVLTNPDEAGKFPASNAVHFGIFYSYGVKCVMPDLIAKISGEASGLTVTSAEGSASGKTAITVAPTKGTGNSYKYKTASSVTMPTYLGTATGYTSWDGTADITATTGNQIVIAELDANGKVVKAGKATVTSKS